MSVQEQKQKPEQKTAAATDETTIPSKGVDTDKLKDDLDALLDEIDEVLEENAEEFVNSYVQKGGQ